MKKYFYNPAVTKTEDGRYSVDIYKYEHRKPVFVGHITHQDYKIALANVMNTVDALNEYSHKSIWKKIFKSN